MMMGVSIGTFTAVAPQGLGMPLVYAIALPIVIKWEPLTGIALLIGASSVSAICAAYLPILFGIPGGSGSQATVLDGYPMGKRGEGRRALGASFMAGGMGALIGTFTLALAIPVARPLIYLMGSPELFVVMLWGLSMVAVLAGRRPDQGTDRRSLRLLLATVGQQAQSGVMRFVFDQPYLLDGISISIIALAMFGIPSALDLALTKLGVEQQPVPLKGSLVRRRQGYVCANGGWCCAAVSSASGWESFPGSALRWSTGSPTAMRRKAAKGGTRNLRQGRRARRHRPRKRQRRQRRRRSHNHIAAGISPGRGDRAVYRRAARLGLFVPGPEMLKKNPELDLQRRLASRHCGNRRHPGRLHLGRSTRQARRGALHLHGSHHVHLHPPGSLQRQPRSLRSFGRRRFRRPWVTSCGVTAIPRPAMILGLVLGDLMEKYLYRSVASYGFTWLARPAVIVLLLLAALSLFFTMRGRIRANAKAEKASPASFSGAMARAEDES